MEIDAFSTTLTNQCTQNPTYSVIDSNTSEVAGHPAGISSISQESSSASKYRIQVEDIGVKGSFSFYVKASFSGGGIFISEQKTINVMCDLSFKSILADTYTVHEKTLFIG